MRDWARSAAQIDAAKEIQRLIGNSVKRVHHGSELVDQTRHTMQEIVTSIQQVNGIVSDNQCCQRRAKQRREAGRRGGSTNGSTSTGFAASGVSVQT